jgi:hypothetical protein
MFEIRRLLPSLRDLSASDSTDHLGLKSEAIACLDQPWSLRDHSAVFLVISDTRINVMKPNGIVTIPGWPNGV